MRLPSRGPVVWTTTVVLTLAMTLGAPPHAALAAPALDQQQPTIDTTVGGLAIGHTSNQILGQTITAGATGDLVRIDLAVACDGTGDLIIQIRDVASTGAPGGTVKSTTTIAGSTLPSFPPGSVTFRALTLAAPVAVTPGAKYAIVLSSNGTTANDGCGIFRGPVGDSYSGGDLYFDALPNAPGWVRVCDFANERCDLPFKTWVEPTALPQGRIVFASGTGLDLVNPDGSGLTSLPCLGACEWPSWSPNGTKIAFKTERDGNKEIYVMNSDGSGQTRLTTNPGLDSDPTWSPDGTKIAWTRGHPTTFQNQIYVMNADGTGQTNVSNNTYDDANPAWSPDGTKIAFVSFRDGNGEIYVMNTSGTGQTRLTTDAEVDTQPAWSPDGTKIAFASSRVLGWPFFDIYVMSATGTAQTRLTTNAATDEGPTWSPDGQRIAFWSDRGGGQRLYHIKPDGTAETVISTVASPAVEPHWGGLSTGETASGSVAAGGSLTTDTEGDGATTNDAIETTVTSPNAGTVTIAESTGGSPAPTGYSSLGVQVTISAPSGTASSPLTLTFEIHSSLIPAGQSASTIQITRNGPTPPATGIIPPCTNPAVQQAVPDPCALPGQTLANGNARIVVYTSAASVWTFVVRKPFDFAGFQAPLRDGVNDANAGRAVPVKFSLGGFQGTDVLAGPLQSRPVSCGGLAGSAPLAAGELVGGAVRYDTATDTYSLVWKTDPSWAGTCRELVLTLIDGSQHTAAFAFK